MATGNISTLSIKGSEETFDTCCSPCSEYSRTTEAIAFCVDCGSNFCEACLRDHNKFAALRSHQIVDKSGKGEQNVSDGVKTTLPTERCAVHHGNVIDKYCRDHDDVCCETCTAVKHRSCVNVVDICKVAKGTQDSTELNKAKDSLSGVLTRMNQEKQKRVDNLINLDKERATKLEDVDTFQDKLIKKIKELAVSSKQQIYSKHEECKKAVEVDEATLAAVISSTTKTLQKLSSSNDVQLFVNIKSSKNALTECQSILSDLSNDRREIELEFVFDQELDDKIASLESLGDVVTDVNVKQYKARLYGTYQVDQNSGSITGACIMKDGTCLIVEHASHRLTRLNDNYTVKDRINLEYPFAVCSAGPSAVAVSLYNKGKIQFVSVGQDLNLATSFAVDQGCYGISHDDRSDEFYVCNSNTRVSVYDKTGTLQRIYETNETGEKLFSVTRHIAFDSAEDIMFVADEIKGSIALKKGGKKQWECADSEVLQVTWGICVMPGGIVFASGISSNNIVQIDKNGEKMGMLIDSSDGLRSPYVVAYDEQTSRLIVGCSEGEIHVYTLVASRK